ncbi:MAG: hypothetical protein A4E65_01565 [Syntrophorhabdus sp. PtaU1.Bin153]|nr:MAG: hypothetical protein A4E65_01565 [Syntrophorhabdus sp. PtaU1.Bin153]
MKPILSPHLHWFLAGVCVYPFLSKIRMIGHTLHFLSVVEHEVIHGFAAVFLGGRFLGFRVTPYGGQADITKSNWFIRLAPYFCPLFTIAFLCLTLSSILDIRPVFLVSSGLFYGNFLSFNTSSLRVRQPDILNTAPLVLVYPVLIMLNLLVAFLLGFILFRLP